MDTVRNVWLSGLCALVGPALCDAPAAADPHRISLRDGWGLRSSEKIDADGAAISQADFEADGWYPVTVPTTVLAGLVANKVYPDPYYADNLTKIPGYRKAPWLVMPAESPFRKPWWYRTTFDAPESLAGKRLTLHLDGINYKANVWLNGRRIADRETVIGMFRRFAFDVTDAVRIGGENGLGIEVIAPGDLPEKRYRTKQLEATTGWDDHNPYPPDMNMGLWRDVYLRATGPVSVQDPYVRSELEVPSLAEARLTVACRLVNRTDKPVEARVTCTIESVQVSKLFKLGAGETADARIAPRDSKSLVLKSPRVWWPSPLGKQELYDLKLRVDVDGALSDETATRFGIREATTYVNDEGWRGYKINGHNVLIRGGAWMTSDMLLRLTHRRYDALIRYAREAGLNMLRSEGFSIRETEEFYDLCDEYGVMVTQQIFGRSIPDEDLAIACVEDMMLRIRKHPSLVHFLGHDETFPTERLDRTYRELIAKHIPDRTYQPHSGAFRIEERFKTGGTRTGSREVWTYATPDHYYVSEKTGAWGFAQSGGIGGIIAPIESMRKMMPSEALWPPWTETWSLHTVTQGGQYFDAMRGMLAARYGEPTSIEAFCQSGQMLNYESARGMFEAYRRNKYSSTGITTWKYNTAWPASPTWQYIDWYLQAGGAYYGAKKACRPLHVQYAYDDHSIYVINGFYRDYKGLRVSARVLDFDLTERFARTETADVPADGKIKCFVIDRPEGLSKTYFLALTLDDADGNRVDDNFYWLSTVPHVPGRVGYKDRRFIIEPKSTADFTALATLPAVRLKTTSSFETQGRELVATVRLENPTEKLAFFVNVAVTRGANGPEVTPAFWSDNYVSLLPGERRTLTGRCYAADLNGAALAIRVTGPNVAGRE